MVRAVHQIKLNLQKSLFRGNTLQSYRELYLLCAIRLLKIFFAAKPSFLQTDIQRLYCARNRPICRKAEIFATDKLRDELLMERFLIFRITCAGRSVKENLLFDIYRTSEVDTDMCFQKEHRQLSTCAHKACYHKVSHH